VTAPTDAEIAKVLRSFMDGHRLRVMPRRGRKRRIVLEQIVQRFEPGCRYEEPDVNEMLRPIWADVAALRRYLVDEELLDRADGFYWRCGGPVEC
jgi:hypothetical protein